MSRPGLIFAGVVAALSAGCGQEIIPFDGGGIQITSLPGIDTFTPDLAVIGTGDTVQFSFRLTQAPTEALAVTIEIDPPSLGTADPGVVVPAGSLDGAFDFTAGDKRQVGTVTVYAGSSVGVPVVVSGLVISELATGSSTSADDEFVELYNPTLKPITLDGTALRYRAASTTSSFFTLADLTGTIASHGYFLVGRNTGYTGPTDQTFGLGMSKDGATLQLLRNGSEVLDQVGWGNAVEFERSAAPPPTYTQFPQRSLERKALPASDATTLSAGGEDALRGNALDTQDNQTDFVIRSVRDPQTAASGVREP